MNGSSDLATSGTEAVPAPIEFEIHGPEYERIAAEAYPKNVRRSLRLSFAVNGLQVLLGFAMVGVSIGRHAPLAYLGVAYVVLGVATAALNGFNLRRMRLIRSEGIVRVVFEPDGIRLGDGRELIRWRSIGSIEARNEAITVMGHGTPIVVIPRRVLSPTGDVWSYFEDHLIGRSLLRRPRKTDRIVNTARRSVARV